MITMTMRFDESVLESFEKKYGINLQRDIEDHLVNYLRTFTGLPDMNPAKDVKVDIRRARQTKASEFDYNITCTNTDNSGGWDFTGGTAWASAKANAITASKGGLTINNGKTSFYGNGQ